MEEKKYLQSKDLDVVTKYVKTFGDLLIEAFQNGKECECRSIVARLKNKFETLGRGTIVFKEPVNGRYCVNLEDICDFILEDLDND